MSGHRNKYEVNEDLAKERAKCNFNVEEVTFIIDGGQQKTINRRMIENIALNEGASLDQIPEECLAQVERYENAVRKSVLYTQIVQDKLLEFTGIEALSQDSLSIRRTADAFFKEISPFLLHLGMFVPTIMGQATPEQQAQWLPKALNFQIIGTYAQTELGHGTFIRGLETKAEYDPQTQEFVLNSPTLTSYKWWAGGLGKTVNYCIVIAQLYTKGECHGVHTFLVQIRDEETHMPLPGIKVGDIGPRMGFNTADNGFLGFENYRIPRENMMMKNSQVLKTSPKWHFLGGRLGYTRAKSQGIDKDKDFKPTCEDGTYVKTAKHSKLTYSTMVFVRVQLVSEAAFNLAKAATIAVRYSAVRRQSEPRPGDPEPQILDYMTQQHKLFICIASAHALKLTSEWLWKTFLSVTSEIKSGNTDSLPELHALSSCLKAISTSDAAALIEQCRFACGGHGYMLSSNLPLLYAFVTATRTYEGDYTVLLLQTARFLVKAWEQGETGQQLTPTVSYFADAFNENTALWVDSPEGMIAAFQAVAAGKISACVKNIRLKMKTGSTYEDAWLLTTVQLVAAAEAHCRAVLCSTYWNETVRLTSSSSSNVKSVMKQLAVLYLDYWTLERTGDLLRYSSISEKDLEKVQHRYEGLLTSIRPNAVGLVDAFDLRDEILNSTLGSYDGRVYERLMEEALKSPLNKEPVNKSFHRYLKPLLREKL